MHESISSSHVSSNALPGMPSTALQQLLSGLADISEDATWPHDQNRICSIPRESGVVRLAWIYLAVYCEGH